MAAAAQVGRRFALVQQDPWRIGPTEWLQSVGALRALHCGGRSLLGACSLDPIGKAPTGETKWDGVVPFD